MNIPRHLLGLMSAVVLALVLIAGGNLLYMNRVYEMANYANRDTVPSLDALNGVLSSFLKLRLRIYRSVINTDAAAVVEIDKSIERARQDIDWFLTQYEAHISNDEDRHYLEDERQMVEDYLVSQQRIVELVDAGRRDEAKTALMNTLPAGLATQAKLEKHIKFNVAMGQAASAEALATTRQAALMSIGFALFCIAVIGILIFQIRNGLKTRHIAAIVDTSEDAIVSKTLDGTITSWNLGAEQVFGYTAREAIGQSITMLIPPERLHEEPEIQARIRDGGRIEHFETVRVRKNGEHIHVSVSVSPILDESGKIIGASKIARNITKAKLAEEALRQAKHEAELANQAKSDFLANMSHEIRTPMNAIIGMTELVLESELAPTQEKYLRKVSASSRAMLRLLNDILDYSKIEAGRMQVEQISFELGEVLRQGFDLFAVEIEKKGLALGLTVAPDVPAQVLGDPMRLSQVLHNLLGNALKFTEEGSIQVELSKLAETADDFVLQFRINDTGIGMTPAQSAQLFKPFVQADSSVTRKYGGTGLGLAICHDLVGLMGGEISVTSRFGIGSTFCFTIRVGRVDVLQGSPSLRESEKPAGQIPARRFSGIHVLLAEDQEVNQEIAVAFIERLGATIVVVDNGQQAVDRAQQESFDVIVLDLHMPVLDGLSAARQLRKRLGAACPPMVAMSAAVLEEDRRRCREAGMVDFIAKPVMPTEVAACFARVLDKADGAENVERAWSIAAADGAFLFEDFVQRLDGNRSLARRLVENTVSTYARFKEDFAALLARKRCAEAAMALHSLRGVFSNMGVQRLVMPALLLEGALKAEQIPGDAALSAFWLAFDQTLGELSCSLIQGANPGTAGEVIPARSLADLLAALAPYLAAGEVIPDDVMSELQAYCRVHPADALAGRLVLCIDAFDHAGALAVLRDAGVTINEGA